MNFFCLAKWKTKVPSFPLTSFFSLIKRFGIGWLSHNLTRRQNLEKLKWWVWWGCCHDWFLFWRKLKKEPETIPFSFSAFMLWGWNSAFWEITARVAEVLIFWRLWTRKLYRWFRVAVIYRINKSLHCRSSVADDTLCKHESFTGIKHWILIELLAVKVFGGERERRQG